MKFKISNFIDHLFRMEGINGGYRWRLARIGLLGVYLHHFVGVDWLGDMHDQLNHDHPKPVRTWGFWTSAGRTPWHEYVNSDMTERISRDSK